MKSLNSNLFQLQSNSAKICFALLVVQQLIVASSTAWVTMLIKDIAAGVPFWTYTVLYLLSLILPFIPGATALVFLSSWQQDIVKAFIERFISSNKARTMIWNDPDRKQTQTAVLTSEGQQILRAASDHIYKLVACSLSVSLNIIILSVLVDKRFAITYGLGLIASFFILIKQRPIQNDKTEELQKNRIDLLKSLISAWDNVVLGNSYNFKIWKQSLDCKFANVSNSTIKLSVLTQQTCVMVAFSTLLPSIGILIYALHQNAGNIPALAALVITLPRLFMILNFTYDLLSLSTQWNEHSKKLDSMRALLNPPALINLEDRIQWSKLVFIKDNEIIKVDSVDSIKELLSTPSRITVCGENGSGKSTLFSWIKEHLGEQVFLLPTHSDLIFDNSSTLSTGQLLRTRLLEIKKNVKANVILLDEWAANLDAENTRFISNLIEDVASRKCVLEIRHFVG